jgi:hypothetical protein
MGNSHLSSSLSDESDDLANHILQKSNKTKVVEKKLSDILKRIDNTASYMRDLDFEIEVINIQIEMIDTIFTRI